MILFSLDYSPGTGKAIAARVLPTRAAKRQTF